jgi:hypothetical protein
MNYECTYMSVNITFFLLVTSFQKNQVLLPQPALVQEQVISTD